MGIFDTIKKAAQKAWANAENSIASSPNELMRKIPGLSKEDAKKEFSGGKGSFDNTLNEAGKNNQGTREKIDEIKANRGYKAGDTVILPVDKSEQNVGDPFLVTKTHTPNSSNAEKGPYKGWTNKGKSAGL